MKLPTDKILILLLIFILILVAMVISMSILYMNCQAYCQQTGASALICSF